MPHAHHSVFELMSIIFGVNLIALVYVRGWFRIRSLGLDRIEAWRGASFLLGLLFVWLVMASPLAELDHELLTVHMIQHLTLMTLAAPLIWLGSPVKPLLHGLLPQRFVKAVIVGVSRYEPLQRLGRVIAQPAVCWLAATGALVGWHVPALFMLGMESGAWHTFEQASFLVAGLLFWFPVVQPRWIARNWSEWSVVLYLFLATVPCDILSGFLVFCGRVVYPVYFWSSRLGGLSALEDQECAGALMWTCVTVVYLTAGAIVSARMLMPERLRQH